MNNKPERIAFFECDCFDKDHLIRAEYSEFISNYKDGTSHKDRDLDITFTTNLADWNCVYDSGLFSWFKKMRWRFRKAFGILFTGVIETEGYFMPARSLVDSKQQKIEAIFGYETTKKFAKWLDTMADRIKADFENDVKEYDEKMKENLNKSTGNIQNT